MSLGQIRRGNRAASRRRTVQSVAFLAGSLVSGRNMPNKKFVTDAGGTYRLAQTARVSVSALQLTFSNWEFDTDGIGDVNGPNSFTIGACYIEHGGTLTPVTFGGATSISVPPGADVQGTATVTIAAGDAYWIRTYVTPDVGGGSYPCISPGQIYYPDELSKKGANVANGTGTGALSDFGDVFAPNAVTGTVTSGTVNGVAVVGDSIAAGIGDDYSTPQHVGWLYRALDGKRPFLIAALSGESASRYLTNGHHRQKYLGPAATYGICEHGINDLQGSQTLAQLQASLITIWTQMRTANPSIKVLQTTITPKSSSTDSWATTTNQTPDSLVHATRRTFNDWLRAGAPMSGGTAVAVGTSGALLAGQAGHPLQDYLEVADVVESARNSGLWKANYTTDGVHPSITGHAALASALDLTKLA